MPTFLAPVTLGGSDANYLRVGTNYAGSGAIRIPNGLSEAITFRNAANNNDILALYVTSSDDTWVNTANGRNLYMSHGGAAIAQFSSAGLTFNPGFNITTYGAGMKIAATIGEKLGFWGATPVSQPSASTPIDDVLANTGLRASGGIGNFTNAISIGTTPASSGHLRLPQDAYVNWRNAANSGNFGFTGNSQDGVLLTGGNYLRVSGNETYGGCLYATISSDTTALVTFRSENASTVAGVANQGSRIAYSCGAGAVIQAYVRACWEASGETDSYYAVQLRSANVITERLRVSSLGVTTTNAVSLNGLTGATATARLVGATTSGAPSTGTFSVGDTVIDRTGKVWINTTAGSPGTFTQVGGSSATTSYWSDAKWGVD